jgi:nucleolar MIF4G domain-containing protein 1
MHLTTALPRQLRAELGLKDTYGAKKRTQNNGPASRKERRKAERKDKRSTRKPLNGRNFREDYDEGDDDDDMPMDSDVSSDEEEEDKSARKPEPKSILKKTKKSAVHDDDEPKPTRKISKGIQDKLAKDDAEIAALEKKLGIKDRKKLPKAFEEEGLADILGELGGDSEEEPRKRKREGDDWLQRKRRKAQGLPSEDEESDEELGSENDILDESEEDDMDDIDEDVNNEDASEDEEFASFDDEDEDDEGKEESEAQPKKVRENPYVAPVVSGDSNRSKYVPPSLRGASTTESENEVRLRRQAQGLLNKLSEANLISILGDVEKLYRENPRQNVTSTLASLLLGLISDPSPLNDTFIILHAGFIAAIYKIIGMDFAAEIIQRLVETFDKSGDEKGAFEGKEHVNLMSLLSQLYNLHVIGSNLVFDYIRLFLQEITETNTELLLKIIRSMSSRTLCCLIYPFRRAILTIVQIRALN